MGRPGSLVGVLANVDVDREIEIVLCLEEVRRAAKRVCRDGSADSDIHMYILHGAGRTRLLPHDHGPGDHPTVVVATPIKTVLGQPKIGGVMNL